MIMSKQARLLCGLSLFALVGGIGCGAKDTGQEINSKQDKSIAVQDSISMPPQARAAAEAARKAHGGGAGYNPGSPGK